MKKEIFINSTLEEITTAENYLNGLTVKLNIPPFLSYKIQLALHEACINALCHGNRKNKNKIIKIGFLEENGKLMLTVEDEGKGFDYTNIPNTPPDSTKESGRGVYLMKMLSDELIFENNGSRVTLCFQLKRTD